ncbi:hypothetical protein QVD17_19562 [Tagetes erecta]|uniref:Uncharacterized protein n=1 Tax=Tagetes erecta TaxID=13708 RepID=A0AAD8KN95_TARER|nr:hypothetical protein QVD17_19562 [Tagetes erecta]
MSNPAGKDQTLALKFESSYAGLKEDQLRYLQKMLDAGNVLMDSQNGFRIQSQNATPTRFQPLSFERIGIQMQINATSFPAT